jgi:hypothetical protein
VAQEVSVEPVDPQEVSVEPVDLQEALVVPVDPQEGSKLLRSKSKRLPEKIWNRSKRKGLRSGKGKRRLQRMTA